MVGVLVWRSLVAVAENGTADPKTWKMGQVNYWHIQSMTGLIATWSIPTMTFKAIDRGWGKECSSEMIG